MANRTRTNRNEFHLDDKEQYILDEKFKLSGMKSKSAFIRKLILYGYVYDVDYSFLREYNTELGRISSSLNQIAKRINSTNSSSFRSSGILFCSCPSALLSACRHPASFPSFREAHSQLSLFHNVAAGKDTGYIFHQR